MGIPDEFSRCLSRRAQEILKLTANPASRSVSQAIGRNIAACALSIFDRCGRCFPHRAALAKLLFCVFVPGCCGFLRGRPAAFLRSILDNSPAPLARNPSATARSCLSHPPSLALLAPSALTFQPGGTGAGGPNVIVVVLSAVVKAKALGEATSL